MRFNTLDNWLSWQETLHPRAVELGLARVRAVLRQLQPESPSYLVITVGGTNGKGSCVALLEAILRAAGYRVGAYSSPHLLRYNERIRIDGREADDLAICQAFARIDDARNDCSLTYFEFGTLAALELFHKAEVDIAILEVGLGGRLDAVNILDADAALVVSVAIDHVDWLGPDRESIAYEKAGIYRPGRPAICADPDPPARLLNYAARLGADLRLVGRDYQFTRTGETWRWWDRQVQFDDLPPPALTGAHQLGNAAAVLATLVSLQGRIPVRPDAIRIGLAAVRLAGRFQVFSGSVEWILDVAHNPHAAKRLASHLRERACDRQTLAVVGLLADKDANGIIQAMTDVVDHWYPTTLGGLRGRTGAELAALLQPLNDRVTISDEVLAACRSAQAAANPGDRIVVFGSFHTVAPALAAQPWNSPIDPFMLEGGLTHG
ncbi:MAG: bifunctional tetrahydrofolate synthase/dihydrofolate synthase [Candidatus Competibacteraceae bacterium]|nr:bifunctional tetrahydrofolate synthase/dihydrofolate synthase [Candidatus Competibacteraceae bacterium]